MNSHLLLSTVEKRDTQVDKGVGWPGCSPSTSRSGSTNRNQRCGKHSQNKCKQVDNKKNKNP